MVRSEIKVGTEVIYWNILKQNGERYEPLKTVIDSDPWELGHGETVCRVVGKSGGVSIKHLDKLSPGSLIAAKLQGLKEISEDEIKSATENLFADKGVNVVVS